MVRLATPYTPALLGALAMSATFACTPPPAREPPPRPELLPSSHAGAKSSIAYAEGALPAIGSESVVLAMDGKTVLATDTTTGKLHAVNTWEDEPTRTLDFGAGSQPGRVDVSPYAAFVSLEGTGELARVDLGSMSVTHRVEVCPAPRGVSVDPTRDRVWVACASGELVGLSRDTLKVLQIRFLEPDMRDVVATPDAIFVSHFRSAQIHAIDPNTPDGQYERSRFTPPAFGDFSNPRHAGVMWRMKQGTRGELLVTYQSSAVRTLGSAAGGPAVPGRIVYYAPAGGSCGNLIQSHALRLEISERFPTTIDTPSISNTGDERSRAQCMDDPLPVDIVEHPCTTWPIGLSAASQPQTEGERTLKIPGVSYAEEACEGTLDDPYTTDPMDHVLAGTTNDYDEVVLWVRGYAGMEIVILHDGATTRIPIDDAPEHLGRQLFHADASSGIACASCHPAGGDDGRVWRFSRILPGEDDPVAVPRRTQNLRAGVEGKLHWDGEFETFEELANDVFSQRMLGFALEPGDAVALRDWLDTLTPSAGRTPQPTALPSVERGEAIFHDPDVGCASCHSGALYTDFEFADVGTGGLLKTPSLLGSGTRGSLMHDGCAKTMRDRFRWERCGGEAHGDLSGLGEADLDDLSAFVESL